MSLKSTLQFIINHPLNRSNRLNALTRFVKWQLNTRLNPYPVIYPYAQTGKLMVSKGMTGATGNIYCGLHEFEDMAFVLHFLRPTDTFVDIGANIGSYTVLAAKEVGAKTVSIEPSPTTFETLALNIGINKIESVVTALNIGLGSRKGEVKFTKSLDTINHIALDGENDTINVPLEVFDEIINIGAPTLIKIDVEGFETEVLKGMSSALSNNNLQGIIIELNGCGNRYGFNDEDIHEKLLMNGFAPYQYQPFERKLNAVKSYGPHNTIYIKDIDFVNKRVQSATTFEILKQKI